MTYFTDRSKTKSDEDSGNDWGGVAKRFGVQLDGDAELPNEATAGREKQGEKRVGPAMPPGMSSEPPPKRVTKYPKHF